MTAYAWIRSNCESFVKRVPCRTKTINSHGFWQENKSGYCSACVWKSGRYGSIMDIAEEYHLKVIEDATEALGSHYTKGRFAGKYAGTIGDFGAYSFNGNKIITTGGGGAVTAKDAKTVAHMQYISTQARMIHIIIFIMKSDIIIA